MRPVILSFLCAGTACALGQTPYILTRPAPGAFSIVQAKTAAAIYVDSADWPGVARAAVDLQADIARVTGVTPALVHEPTANAIVIGTIGKSALLDRMIREKKIDVAGVAGKWEAFAIQTVAGALVIAGSDKRGAIYGIYDVSEQIGVSPWYFWADVPVVHRDALFVKPGRYMEGEPAVKYRGIFLNDESPALSGWVREKFGMAPVNNHPGKPPDVVNMNHEFYAKVFELILRLKGNYLWPAMWNNAFNEDDPLNAKAADEYGIVMGSSHHEPMLRAQKEWTRHGTGPWDYSKNADVLKAFWTEGIRRNKDFESIVTIGMRGDGDMPMAGPNLDDNVKLLEQIVADQRGIIARERNPDVTKVPQLWALYKEVQGYYEKGMRVPDDVTLLWCDDNWGNIRRLPTPEERKRSGGAGIYYHFDYVGGPRNYKWIDTNPLPKIWEQMNLALHYGADRIWIVNVGDLKPMEFPTDFFLNFARDPARWPKEKLGEFTRLWAEREFGAAHAAEIADLVSTYLKYAGRRKPELLDPATFSLTDYREAERVESDFNSLRSRAETVQAALPAAARPAFFELVLHPILAYGQVAELYIAAGRNKQYAEQGRAAANDQAARVKALFQADADLTNRYNHTLLDGKWDHMMDQTHIGYTYWQEPPGNTMPAVQEVELPAAAAMGVDAESGAFDVFNRQRRYIDVYNKGKASFDFTATAGAPWIVLSRAKGTVAKQERLWVSVDWSKAPAGTSQGTIQVAGAGTEVTVNIAAFHPREITPATLRGFVEADGYISIEAGHFSKNTAAGGARWEKIPDFGRTLSAMSVFPVDSASKGPGAASPSLDYRMYLFHGGDAEVTAILGPSQNFVPGRGLRFAMAFDDGPTRIIDTLEHNTQRDWEETVKDGVRYVKTRFPLAQPGYHTLRVWMVDPGIVLEKFVVDLGGVKPSYLGPPESFHSSVAE
ncbi:MAG TPA: glycosyl hydrolase 115 family protein [Bryobacteraceae bacterium]|jgi:hypothetical protein|nr:glycosyl hydrolase 115 family protein [Bryobacteraceae bacterium]